MLVKHKISFMDCEVLVCDNEDSSYHVSIQSLTNPLGRGNVLDTFDDEQLAIQAAERFHWMYTIAKENGYYLKENCFTKPNRQEVHISIMKDGDITKEQYVMRLQA
ncbi:MAG: hypothetical protein K0R67_399 [Paenibacillus sp.]|jgi:hypothetical protein|nr:hypothetical protein [Paenibacillus sp.]